MPEEIAAALANGACVLTANARAARALQYAFAHDARASGQTSWRAPAIHDWNSWLQQLYQELSTHVELPVLLSSAQENLLWSQVQAEDAAAVVSPHRLADLAQSAYALLSDYEAHTARRAPWAAAHEDAERFLAWAQAFDQRCEDLHVLSRAQLAAHLRPHLAKLTLPNRILLVGFDRVTPSQQAFISSLAAAGVAVERAQLAPAASIAELVRSADQREELRACAFWVRSRLEQNPHQRIAILVPELRSLRAEIDRTFRRILTPSAACSPASGGSAPFEFSLGQPLATVPLVAAALLLLHWLTHPLTAANLTSLLTSGFLAADLQQHRALAQLANTLLRKRLVRIEITLPAFLELTVHNAALFPAEFAARLQTLLQASRSPTRGTVQKLSRADWTDHIQTVLDTSGWPGFYELDSVAYQAREQFEALLTELATLDAFAPPATLAQCIGELSILAHNKLFTPESSNPPVTILGASEASGQSFDAVWFLGVTEQQWPLRGAMHPLLASSVQREAAMPHATPQADLELAREQTARILASAPELVCSYALQGGGGTGADEAEARLSPLLRDLPFTQDSSPAQAALLQAQQARHLPPAEYSVAQEVDGIDQTPWPLARSVGSDALKRQSACAFQSFATSRLGARPRDEESWGLDAGERGELLHSALQQLWATQPAPPQSDRLHTSDDLHHALANNSLEEKVRAAVRRAFRKQVAASAADPWRSRYLQAEQERVELRILWWLDIERLRAPFRVVSLEEKIENASVGPLRLNLRVDRIDQLSDDTRLLLDYKTGSEANTKLWLGERPEEPQLPLYSQFAGIANVSALGFAQVRASSTCLQALAADPPTQLGDKLKAQPLAPELRAEWDGTLLRLAHAFAQGEATVDPRDGKATCRTCGLYGLCRIRSRSDSELDEDEFDEESLNA